MVQPFDDLDFFMIFLSFFRPGFGMVFGMDLGWDLGWIWEGLGGFGRPEVVPGRERKGREGKGREGEEKGWKGMRGTAQGCHGGGASNLKGGTALECPPLAL